MALHNDLGKKGEELAANWLVGKGYSILHRNWRYGQNEVDIIARIGKFLCFIEVKTRKHPVLGYPEDSVTKMKFKNIQRVAHGFLLKNPNNPWIQYHILSITFYDNKETEYFLIQDVYMK